MEMKEVIRRINELAGASKARSLTEEEKAEQQKLRRIYIDSVKSNLSAQLDSTYVVQPDGTSRKLGKKKNS